jgi:hypothetical protein
VTVAKALVMFDYDRDASDWFYDALSDAGIEVWKSYGDVFVIADRELIEALTDRADNPHILRVIMADPR